MEEQLLALMKKRGVAVMRESYLHHALFGDIPNPSAPEHEVDLPAELQD
jgi:hypothetical protein